VTTAPRTGCLVVRLGAAAARPRAGEEVFLAVVVDRAAVLVRVVGEIFLAAALVRAEEDTFFAAVVVFFGAAFAVARLGAVLFVVRLLTAMCGSACEWLARGRARA
jgi:hypothetical protein